ncbi:MAG: RidA family protein [Alphaproteobacteria bacterium]|nr:RidA family protein [Alphaproteobacteria bacterium]
MTGHRILLPEGWPRPKGYAHGIAAKGTTIFLGGQIGWDEKGIFASGFVGQVRQALKNIARLLADAGTTPETVVRLNWFVTDLAAYNGNLKDIGKAYREVFGTHYPAMTLVAVAGLVEPDAMVEIEATAVIPD